LGFLLELPDNLVFSRRSLPTIKVTDFLSPLPPHSISFLELLASCNGMPELLAPWLELHLVGTEVRGYGNVMERFHSSARI
jgi:hypothetical protein